MLIKFNINIDVDLVSSLVGWWVGKENYRVLINDFRKVSMFNVFGLVYERQWDNCCIVELVVSEQGVSG